jgi:pilus assembly protein CpaE
MSVLLVADPSTTVLEDALRAGVRDVIDPRGLHYELEPALRFAVERTAHLRRLREAAAPASTPKRPLAASSPNRPVAGSSPNRPVVASTPKGRVVVVLSPKGGSGKTMVASNVAAALARSAGGSVALVDLDVEFGDVASALGLSPEHTIGKLAQVPPIDRTMLKAFLTRHEPSGAFVLCGSSSPEAVEAVTHEHATRIVELLAEDFSYVVVDTPAGFDERTVAAVGQATDVVFVASMDVSSIRNLGKEIAALDRLGMATVERHFVLNRADARVGMDVEHVQVALGMRVDAAVPSTRAIPLSMNHGRALVIEEPATPAAKELVKLARRLIGVETNGSGRKRGFLRRRK